MSMRYRRSSAGTPAQNANRHAFKRSALALSISLLLAGPAFAQDASSKPADEKEKTTNLEKVVVTGIRGSVYKAQDIKRDADTFVDSVTALDIGALPDRSVTETLSRIPGVTIDHFLSVGDPEHFSAEGNGVQVRGLTQVRSELNGRDSFSASGGRSLSFQDVPSELMSGVDVFKNQTAEMVEGGLGGTVNLRTFMPFDFDGMKLGVSVSENYGNFVKKWKPSASALFSNRWTTGAGDFGILVDVAHSELATRTDGLFVRPFFKTSNSDLTGDGVNDVRPGCRAAPTGEHLNTNASATVPTSPCNGAERQHGVVRDCVPEQVRRTLVRGRHLRPERSDPGLHRRQPALRPQRQRVQLGPPVPARRRADGHGHPRIPSRLQDHRLLIRPEVGAQRQHRTFERVAVHQGQDQEPGFHGFARGQRALYRRHPRRRAVDRRRRAIHLEPR